MTEAFVADESLRRRVHPDRVAPAVLWLASDACAVSGRVLVAGGGNFGSAHTLQGDGAWLDDSECTPEGVAAAADRILKAEHLRSHADAGAHFASLLDAVRSRGQDES